MFLVELKNFDNKDDVFKFNEPLTFTEVNEMLIDAVKRYQIRGIKSKIGYKIIDQITKEPVLNSRIIISNEIESFFDVISMSQNIDQTIKKFVNDVALGNVSEIKSIVVEDGKYKTKVEDLRQEKERLMSDLRQQELVASDRELSHQEQVNRLQQEIQQIQSVIDSKSEETSDTNSERIKQIKELENERRKIEEQATQTRNDEKRKKEKHEQELAELEEKRKLAEVELITVQEQAEMAEIERKKRRLILEEEERKLKMEVELTQNQDDLAKVKSEEQMKKSETTESTNDLSVNHSTVAVSTPVIEEEEQDKYKIALNKTLIILKKTFIIIKKGSRYIYIKGKRSLIKYKRNREKQKTLDIQLKKAKIDFLSEIQKEKQKQEVLLQRKERERERIEASYQRKQERYLKEVKRGKGSHAFSFKKLFKISLVLVVIYLIIDFSLNKEQSHFTFLQHKGLEIYYSIKSYF